MRHRNDDIQVTRDILPKIAISFDNIKGVDLSLGKEDGNGEGTKMKRKKRIIGRERENKIKRKKNPNH